MTEPERFGKYVLTSRLAVGGMAEVFRAKLLGEAGFERSVALKRILPGFSEDEAFIKMFIDEARIAGRLTHGNIVQTLELGRCDGTYYIAMELVAGMDLSTLVSACVDRDVSPDVNLACFVVTEVCRGLSYAHGATDDDGRPLGIIHRDISPQNVLLSFNGDVKISDFGIAKAWDRVASTRAGMVKGKLDYMAPEQYDGDPLDARADIYALGVVFYELLTFQAFNTLPASHDFTARLRARPVPRVSAANDECDASLDAIVQRCVAPDPKDRYPDAQSLERHVTRYLKARGGYSKSDLGDFLRTHLAEVTVRHQIATAEESLLAEDLEDAGEGRPVEVLFAPGKPGHGALRSSGGTGGSGRGVKVTSAPRLSALGADHTQDIDASPALEELGVFPPARRGGSTPPGKAATPPPRVTRVEAGKKPSPPAGAEPRKTVVASPAWSANGRSGAVPRPVRPEGCVPEREAVSAKPKGRDAAQTLLLPAVEAAQLSARGVPAFTEEVPTTASESGDVLEVRAHLASTVTAVSSALTVVRDTLAPDVVESQVTELGGPGFVAALRAGLGPSDGGEGGTFAPGGSGDEEDEFLEESPSKVRRRSVAHAAAEMWGEEEGAPLDADAAGLVLEPVEDDDEVAAPPPPTEEPDSALATVLSDGSDVARMVAERQAALRCVEEEWGDETAPSSGRSGPEQAATQVGPLPPADGFDETAPRLQPVVDRQMTEPVTRPPGGFLSTPPQALSERPTKLTDGSHLGMGGMDPGAPRPTMPSLDAVPALRSHHVGKGTGRMVVVVPDAASVVVDGRGIGQGRVLLTGLDPKGKYALQVTQPGCETWKSVVSLGGKPAGQVKVQMRAVTSPGGVRRVPPRPPSRDR
jgi:hypothetical protein